MQLRILALASLLFVCGCLPQVDDPDQLNRIRVIMEQDGAKVMEQKRAQIRESQLPSNYQDLIDARFVDILKDPDSRRVEYRDNPYGSLVCGAINARNSYGGYTGKQPFLAYFDASGKLGSLKSYSDQAIEALSRFKNAEYAIPTSQLEDYALLRDCGY